MKFKPIGLLAVFVGFAGCSGMNKVDRNIDMASEHVTSQKPVYEGKVTSSKRVGALTSIQFEDGQLYDVNNAPTSLEPGDIVRIYTNDNGFEAHLWHASTQEVLPSIAPPVPAPAK